MGLTLSLIWWVSVRADNSPSMGTCSVVKGLESEWTRMEWETVFGGIRMKWSIPNRATHWRWPSKYNFGCWEKSSLWGSWRPFSYQFRAQHQLQIDWRVDILPKFRSQINHKNEFIHFSQILSSSGLSLISAGLLCLLVLTMLCSSFQVS